MPAKNGNELRSALARMGKLVCSTHSVFDSSELFCLLRRQVEEPRVASDGKLRDDSLESMRPFGVVALSDRTSRDDR